MNPELFSYILPKGLLEYFIITKVEEFEEESTKELSLKLHLEEINKIPAGYESSEYESKGFSSEREIQDFPLRGKPVYLSIKRRYWRRKDNKNKVIHNDYKFIAEGSSITKELSDFLKYTDQ